MYRDVAQWAHIRHQILRESVSIEQIVRETGISQKTVRKMRNHRNYPRPMSATISGADGSENRSMVVLASRTEQQHSMRIPEHR
jgi:hypothetical protein